jgi:hypothetical protein
LAEASWRRPSRSASTATGGRRCSAWRPSPAKPRCSGPISCALWAGVDCAALCWSPPMPMRG